MDHFHFYAPTWFEFGKDAERQVGSLVRRFGGTKVLIHYGGGSTIDSSKAIALGTVLTIAAAGSEGSPDSVITKEEGMLKRSAHGDVLRARFSVMNPALTQTLPPYQTACGITDIIAHLYERYLTNTREVETTDRLMI